nr:hypothetical protein [Tanacetum cinerariifolium]
MLQALQERLKNGEGTSQQRDNGGQTGQNRGNNGGAYGCLTKIKFPKFKGDEVQSWLYRVNKFFEMDNIGDDVQKIRLVSMHMFRKAFNWHKHFMAKFGEKYVPGHKCSGQVFSLEVIRTDMYEDVDLLLSKQGVASTFYSFVDKQPLISLNALTGMNTYKTMRIRGCVGKNALHVLADSGSTHNFLDLQVAKKLGCRLRKSYPLEVFVANGNVMSSTYEGKGFT